MMKQDDPSNIKRDEIVVEVLVRMAVEPDPNHVLHAKFSVKRWKRVKRLLSP